MIIPYTVSFKKEILPLKKKYGFQRKYDLLQKLNLLQIQILNGEMTVENLQFELLKIYNEGTLRNPFNIKWRASAKVFAVASKNLISKDGLGGLLKK